MRSIRISSLIKLIAYSWLIAQIIAITITAIAIADRYISYCYTLGDNGELVEVERRMKYHGTLVAFRCGDGWCFIRHGRVCKLW